MELEKFLETLKVDVENAVKDLEKIKSELDKAKAIGLDITELTERYESQKKQIELVKEVYKI